MCYVSARRHSVSFLPKNTKVQFFVSAVKMLISEVFRENHFSSSLNASGLFLGLGFLFGVFCYEYLVLSLSSLQIERVVYRMFSELLVCVGRMFGRPCLKDSG